MILRSSNNMKIKEFKSYLPDLIIKEGVDLREVNGNIDEVIIHKSIDAGKDILVEDSVLFINNVEVVDIKWKLKSLKEGDLLKWVVSIGYNDGTHVNLYRGIVNGIATIPDNVNNINNFDPYFIPEELINSSKQTLHDLNLIGLKEKYSARAKAAQLLKNGDLDFFVLIKDIKPWTGSYQNE